MANPASLPTIILPVDKACSVIAKRLGISDADMEEHRGFTDPATVLANVFPNAFQIAPMGYPYVCGSKAFVLIFADDEALVEFRLRWL